LQEGELTITKLQCVAQNQYKTAFTSKRKRGANFSARKVRDKGQSSPVKFMDVASFSMQRRSTMLARLPVHLLMQVTNYSPTALMMITGNH
jgi:hypothetical protein